MKRALLYTILFVTFTSAFAQEFPVRQYNMKDGLLHATVYDIFQDKKGFIWLCTDYGLSKFNGSFFTNYTEKDGLSNKTIQSISEDENGDKYLSTYKGGISVVKGNNIQKLQLSHGSIPSNITYTVGDKNNIYTVGLTGGRRLYRIHDNKIAEISFPVTGATPYRLYRYGADVLVATSNGIYKIQNETSLVAYMPQVFGGKFINDIKPGRDNSYWVAAEGKVYKVQGQQIVSTYSHQGTAANILADKNENIWITTDEREFYIIKDGEVSNITSFFRIPRIYITDIFEDNEGNIWIATQGLGVFRINSFDVINFPASEKINIYCNSIAVVDSNIWTGSIGTVSVYDKKGMDIAPLQTKLSHNEFVYFVRKIGNKVYIGTPSRFIAKDTRPPYSETVLNKENMGALSVCEGKNGEILIGSYNGVYKLSNGQVTLFDSIAFTRGRRCEYLAYDAAGALWIATDSNIVKYENGTCTYPQVPGWDHSFRVGRMLLDKNGRMWFSTPNGLVCKTGTDYRVFGIKDGMSDSSCRELFADDHGKLWVSTFSDVNIIDLATLDIDELIVEIKFSEILSLSKLNNQLFVGTIEGMSVINIAKQGAKPLHHPIYITSVRTEDSTYQMPQRINLAYDNNKLEISFAGLYYRYPEKVEYRYRINNMDTGWQVTRSNSIELSAIPGGSYEFLLSSRLENGEWSDPVVLPIVIATPFWKTWWFLAIVFIAVIAVVYIIIKKIITISEKNKREKLLILNKINYLKQQALSALINPHFIFNCMNSIQHFLNKKDNDMANVYLSDFAGLIRMTMENAQKVFISLEEETARIELYLALEKLRIGDRLEYEVSVASELRARNIRIPNMILQPYIENAIWHGIMPNKGSGKILVSFEPKDDTSLKIIIKDNGVGIGAARQQERKQHKSLGMKLTENRLNLLNQLLNEYYTVNVLKPENEKGTIIEIILPYHPNERDMNLLEEELGMH